MKANLFLLTISIILITIAGIFEVNFFNYGSPIPYSEWESIDWFDFKGLNRPFVTLHGNSDLAFICPEIKVIKEDDCSTTITTYFHPSRSYVFNQKTIDKNLFRHELNHLHITEYCARLFRKELSETRCPNSGYLDALANKYLTKEDSLQRLYDKETYHSFVLSKQRAWEKRIRDCLDSLHDFKATLVNQHPY